jgi:hypothetical protein
MSDTMSDKPTFLHIRAASNLKLEAIAEEANVPIEDVYYLEAGVPYPKEVITQVLGALSRLTGEQYTLDDVLGIHTTEEGPHEQ